MNEKIDFLNFRENCNKKVLLNMFVSGIFYTTDYISKVFHLCKISYRI